MPAPELVPPENDASFLEWVATLVEAILPNGADPVGAKTKKAPPQDLRNAFLAAKPRAERLLAGVNKLVVVQQPAGLAASPWRGTVLDCVLGNRTLWRIETSQITDVLKEGAAALRLSPANPTGHEATKVHPGSIFVAMPMNEAEYPELADTYETIKRVAKTLEMTALRIDDEASIEPITPRILEHLARSEYVVADLTYGKPNVYLEAGFSMGQGKNPVFIAKTGTELYFDVKDYPVIFFQNQKQLESSLEKRISDIHSMNRGT